MDISFPTRNEYRLRLCNVLWAWNVCQACIDEKACEGGECPRRRLCKLRSYFAEYRRFAAAYRLNARVATQPVLQSHHDLIHIIERLKIDPNAKRLQLASSILVDTSNGKNGSEDIENAVNLAVRVMTMINCPQQGLDSDILELGTNQIPWLSEFSLCEYIRSVLPTARDHFQGDGCKTNLQGRKHLIKARKLQKHLGLKIRPTNDLTNHLKYDRNHNVLEVFHYTAFLKEHLRLTKTKSALSLKESLEL